MRCDFFPESRLEFPNCFRVPSALYYDYYRLPAAQRLPDFFGPRFQKFIQLVPSLDRKCLGALIRRAKAFSIGRFDFPGVRQVGAAVGGRLGEGRACLGEAAGVAWAS